ncbi:unnamed protein product [Psylliodes chrysocephalus]|uniref:Uncharacterized protein n=1 Tax=Psylliodes chrysocephalus TaxID=3402493 RepID=A0A9P0D786_9CUCU|nr:unnamed protein product [Psylliodes chrysocephala]
MYQYPYQYSMQCYPESHQYLNEHSIECNHCPNSYPVQCNPNPCVPNHNYPCTADCEHLCSRHRDPEEVFREFFGNSIFDFLSEDFSMDRREDRDRCSRSGGRRGHRGHEVSIFGPLGGGGGGLFEGFFSTPSATLQSSFGVHGSVPTSSYIRKVSTSTKILNGKKMTTKRIYENGKEVVMNYENDVLTSKTVNGVPQSIQYRDH